MMKSKMYVVLSFVLVAVMASGCAPKRRASNDGKVPPKAPGDANTQGTGGQNPAITDQVPAPTGTSGAPGATNNNGGTSAPAGTDASADPADPAAPPAASTEGSDTKKEVSPVTSVSATQSVDAESKSVNAVLLTLKHADNSTSQFRVRISKPGEAQIVQVEKGLEDAPVTGKVTMPENMVDLNSGVIEVTIEKDKAGREINRVIKREVIRGYSGTAKFDGEPVAVGAEEEMLALNDLKKEAGLVVRTLKIDASKLSGAAKAKNLAGEEEKISDSLVQSVRVYRLPDLSKTNEAITYGTFRVDRNDQEKTAKVTIPATAGGKELPPVIIDIKLEQKK
ncbi:MAG: hypothetical protein IT289_10945 [Oligoflexia bacterium]|nr:hypothetical protein [Oligoflexia bacterium]